MCVAVLFEIYMCCINEYMIDWLEYVYDGWVAVCVQEKNTPRVIFPALRCARWVVFCCVVCGLAPPDEQNTKQVCYTDR
jgi:hypothetical protein